MNGNTDAREGTNLLEPDFSIAEQTSSGRAFPSPSQGRHNTNEEDGIILEPDFDYDLDPPLDFGSLDNNNGIDIEEPEFGIDGFDDANNT